MMKRVSGRSETIKYGDSSLTMGLHTLKCYRQSDVALSRLIRVPKMVFAVSRTRRGFAGSAAQLAVNPFSCEEGATNRAVILSALVGIQVSFRGICWIGERRGTVGVCNIGV